MTCVSQTALKYFVPGFKVDITCTTPDLISEYNYYRHSRESGNPFGHLF
jgi:hypothetical protein